MSGTASASGLTAQPAFLARRHSARITFASIAAILLIAAILKAHQLLTEPLLAGHRGLSVLLVQLELLFAIWLLAGRSARLARMAVIILFLVFAVVSLYRGISGESSCGCFGAVKVSPWISLLLDVLVIATAGSVSPKMVSAHHRRLPSLKPVPLILAYVGIAACSSFFLLSFHPTTLSAKGLLLGDSSFILADPEGWIGEQCPIIDWVDEGHVLREGKWIVLFFHFDCPLCREVLPEFVQRSLQPDSDRIAILEVPPFGREQTDFGKCLHLRLSDSHEWFVESPREMHIANGRVVSVSRPKGR